MRLARVLAASLLLAATAALAADPQPSAPPAPAKLDDRDCWSHGEVAACEAAAMPAVKKGKYRHAAAAWLVACHAGRPDACAGLAVLHAGGLGVAKDDARAVALARRGCEGGSQAACSSLATLLALGRGAPAAPEEAARLREGACAAGVAQACAAPGTAAPHPLALEATGKPPAGWPEAKPPSRNTKLFEMFQGAYQASRAIAYGGVPRDLRPALGLDPEPFIKQETIPEDFDVAEGALRGWALTLRPCAEAGAKGQAMVAWAAFQASDAEAPSGVRVTGLDLRPEVEACLREAVGKWDLRGLVRPGVRYLVRAPLVMGDPLPPPPAPPPAAEGEGEVAGLAAEGVTRPAMRQRGCVGRALSEVDWAEWPAERTEFMFVVGRDGAVGRFHAKSPVTTPVATAVRQAVMGCAWEPAKDAAGEARAAWVVLPLRFAR